MGADLIGYFMFCPEKLTKEEIGVINKHIRSVRVKLKVKENENFDNWKEEIEKILPDIGFVIDELGDTTLEEISDRIEAAIEEVENDIGKTGMHLDNRDCCSQSFKVLNPNPLSRPLDIKRSIHVYFAGEMSWRETPEGSYAIIRAYHECGVADILRKFCFGEE